MRWLIIVFALISANVGLAQDAVEPAQTVQQQKAPEVKDCLELAKAGAPDSKSCWFTETSRWAAWGQWANVFTTFLTALAVFILTWMSYRDSKKKNKLELIAQQVSLINTWNSMLIANPTNMETFEKMGPTVISVLEDNLIFTYLNYGRIVWEGYLAKLVSEDDFQRQLRNVAEVFHHVPPEKMKRLVARGYPQGFVEHFIPVFEVHYQPAPASA
ncbi:hypothetical protein [Bradyrhizobium sp.]|uniref:hypothetical protein n=1 Tax=Bradyrhizobium sp. TaxID=376 RepID=UPI002734D70C|nr:hypothetical protein [Bradyrhizobium sp.]MDP3693230.1 hypothetical protein [Bradyrhizobium sp.]